MTAGGGRQSGGTGERGAATSAAPGRARAVVAGDGDAFADVLARVRAAGRGGAPVDLVVARESGLLLTAGEFRALRDAIDRDRLAVTLRCDDALRDGLARAMGIERRRIPPELRPPLARFAAGQQPSLAGASAGQGAAAASDPHEAFRPPAAGSSAGASPAAGRGAAPSGAARSGERAAGARSATGTTGPASATRPGAGEPKAGPAHGASTAASGSAASSASVSASAIAPVAFVGTGPPASGAAGRASGTPGPAGEAVPAAAGPTRVARAGGNRVGQASPPARGAEPGAGIGTAPSATAPAGAGSWPEQPGHPAPPPAPQRPKPGSRFRRRRDDRPSPGAAAGSAAADGLAQEGGAGEPPSLPSETGGPGDPSRPRPAGFDPFDDAPTGPTFDQIVAPRYRGARRPRWLGFAVAALVLVALGALAAALLMPRATVAVTLRTAPVAGEAVLDVTATGQPLDGGATMAVAATPIEVEVAFAGSVPVTGVRAEPDAAAAGTVRFANPAAEPVVVPAGTELTTGGGLAFLTDAEITVPGADPATGEAGQADGAIRAAQPGTGGNVEVGEIGGRLPSGVYYSNREEATAGGTDREIRVVAAADLDALRAQADAALAEEATAAAQEQLGEGVEVLPGSVSVVANDETFSAEEGAEAESVSLEAARTVRALAWSPEETLARARQLLAESPPAALAGQVPAGYAIDPGSVRFGEPQPGEGSADGTRLRLPVEAVAAPPFGPSERRALAERLAGLDEAAATAALAQEPAFADSRLEFSPGWLPRRMPSDPGRIEIEAGP